MRLTLLCISWGRWETQLCACKMSHLCQEIVNCSWKHGLSSSPAWSHSKFRPAGGRTNNNNKNKVVNVCVHHYVLVQRQSGMAHTRYKDILGDGKNRMGKKSTKLYISIIELRIKPHGHWASSLPPNGIFSLCYFFTTGNIQPRIVLKSQSFHLCLWIIGTISMCYHT